MLWWKDHAKIFQTLALIGRNVHLSKDQAQLAKETFLTTAFMIKEKKKCNLTQPVTVVNILFLICSTKLIIMLPVETYKSWSAVTISLLCFTCCNPKTFSCPKYYILNKQITFFQK